MCKVERQVFRSGLPNFVKKCFVKWHCNLCRHVDDPLRDDQANLKFRKKTGLGAIHNFVHVIFLHKLEQYY